MPIRFERWIDRLTEGFKKKAPAGPSLFHYTRQDGSEKARIHLRVDPDGSGLLLVNASRVMHLNPKAALMARLALDGVAENEALRRLTRQYQVTSQQALSDYTQFIAQLDQLVSPDGACPVHDLNLEITMP